jgi:hypothetical protein
MLPPTPTATDDHALPAGARCALHLERAAHGRCAECERLVCVACARVVAGGATICAGCEERKHPTIPWEQRREVGIARAALQTISGVLLRPGALFSLATRERALWPALAFGLSLHVVAQLVTFGFDLAFLSQTRAELREDPLLAKLPWLASPEFAAAQLALSPLVFLLGTLAGAAAWSIGLRIVGGLQRPFHVIVRALCYAQATALIIAIAAPLGHAGPAGAGALLAVMLWALAIQIVAVSRMQGIEIVRGVAAFLVWSAIVGTLACIFLGVIGWWAASHIEVPTGW